MKLYGIIGKTLRHSFSQKYFTKKFENESITAAFNVFPLKEIAHVVELCRILPDLAGFSVTIPYKSEIIHYLTGLHPTAKAIGAVNCVKVVRTGNEIELWGYNTDYVGFSESLKPFLNPKITSALVLGTGGASKAVVFALEQLNIRTQLVSRSAEHLIYEQLTAEIIANNLLIVNTTPLGTFPNISEFPPIPYYALTAEHVMYDLVYNPAQTAFLQKSADYTANLVNGMNMLELQAEAAWEIWNTWKITPLAVNRTY